MLLKKWKENKRFKLPDEDLNDLNPRLLSAFF